MATGDRERGTTLESRDCPVWCAALTSSRLPSQAPAAPKPTTRAGGACGTPLLGMGTNKSGIALSKKRKSSASLNSSTPGKAPAPPPGAGAVLARARKPSWAPPSRRTRPPAGRYGQGSGHLGQGLKHCGRKPLGGVGRAAGDPKDAPRSRLWSHTAVRQRAGAERGTVGALILRRRAAFLAHVLCGGAKHEPALDVAPGIPRRLMQPLGLAGPLVGRSAWGALGLRLRRPPVFPHIGRCPNRAAWGASLGFHAQQTTHTSGPPATLPPPFSLGLTRSRSKPREAWSSWARALVGPCTPRLPPVDTPSGGRGLPSWASWPGPGSPCPELPGGSGGPKDSWCPGCSATRTC